jgi:hypothetical protein
MKLGCTSHAYEAALHKGRLDLHTWIRHCAEEMELDGIELLDAHVASGDLSSLRETKRLSVELGLTLASIAVRGGLRISDRNVSGVDDVKRGCDLAAYLGAPIVRVAARESMTASDGTGRLVGVIRRLFGNGKVDWRRNWSDLDHAAERGVVIAVENDPEGPLAPAQRLWQCVHDVGSPWLRSAPQLTGALDDPGIELALQHAVLARTALRDVRADGSDTSARLPEAVRRLRLAPYRGFLLIDYDGAEEPESVIPRAERYVRGLFHLLARQELLGSPESRNGHPPVVATPSESVSHAIEVTPVR